MSVPSSENETHLSFSLQPCRGDELREGTRRLSDARLLLCCAVDRAASRGKGIYIEGNDLAVREEIAKSRRSLFVRSLISEFLHDDSAIANIVSDVTSCEIVALKFGAHPSSRR